MKILHIIPSLKVGGAERLVVDICDEISKQNIHEVKLITFSDDFKSFEQNKLYHKHISSSYHPSITSNSKTNIDNLQDLISDFNPDIIHSHLWEAEMLLTQINTKKAVRFSHFHDNISQLKKTKISFSKNVLTDFFERNIFYKNNSNHFICISNDTLDYANKVLPKKLIKHIYLLKNAIDFQKCSSYKEKSLKEINLINMGSFVPKKNQKFAVQILNELIIQGYNATLTFLGDGQNIDDVKSYANKLKIQEYINFMGNIADVKPYLEDSNFYVHTANYEPFGLVLIEAMAAGLPVISLDGYGNRDFIEHGINGYIFKDQNPKYFFDCIIKLFADNKLYMKIQNNGYKTAKKYDIKEYTSELIEIYQNSL
jgi:glycosyltransferase involved in cell wall biosynthesis